MSPRGHQHGRGRWRANASLEDAQCLDQAAKITDLSFVLSRCSGEFGMLGYVTMQRRYVDCASTASCWCEVEDPISERNYVWFFLRRDTPSEPRMPRGSARCGSAVSSARVATPSKPMKAKKTVPPARSTPGAPCGACGAVR